MAPRNLSLALAVGGMTVFALIGRSIGRRDDILRAGNAELNALSIELRRLSRVDALTGVANRPGIAALMPFIAALVSPT